MKELSEEELVQLLDAVVDTSKSIRSNTERTTSTAKVMQYENMLRLIEMYKINPDLVRMNLRNRS